MVRVFLECGADTHMQDREGLSLLRRASSKGHHDIMRLRFLDYGSAYHSAL